jgi:hypothetical protein
MENKAFFLLGPTVGLVLYISPPAWSQIFLGGFSSASDLKWTSSLSSNYLDTYVTPAASSWNGISSKVKLTKVTSGTYQVSVVTSTTTRAGLLEVMVPYCTISGVNKSSDDCLTYTWNSAQIIGYTNQITAYNLNTSQIISNVYTHEFGHALSLAHTYDPLTPSVLLDSSTLYSLSPQQLDKTNLKRKWGN